MNKTIKLTILLSLFTLKIYGQENGQCQNVPTFSCNGQTYPIHLTFSDGPSIPSTGKILDALKKTNTQATFFIQGQNLETPNPEIDDLIKTMQANGHNIGSQGYQHFYPTRQSRATLEQDIQAALNVGVDRLGNYLTQPLLYRFPYGDGWKWFTGSNRNTPMSVIHSNGFNHIGWSMNISDWDTAYQKGSGNQSLVFSKMKREICNKQGGVVLMHDTQEYNAQNMEEWIKILKCSGFRFESLNYFNTRPEVEQTDRAATVNPAPAISTKTAIVPTSSAPVAAPNAPAPATNIITLQSSPPANSCSGVSKFSCNGQTYPIHLTFDDGPVSPNTQKVLAALKKHSVKASFFVLGSHIDQELANVGPIVEQMRADGHNIGSHGYYHYHHTQQSKATLEQDIPKTLTAGVATLGDYLTRPLLYRFPYGDGWQWFTGDNRSSPMSLIHSQGYNHVGWSNHCSDWDPQYQKGSGANSLVFAKMKREICKSQGGVVLLHDLQKHTADNLDQWINILKCSGFTFEDLAYFKERSEVEYPDTDCVECN